MHGAADALGLLEAIKQRQRESPPLPAADADDVDGCGGAEATGKVEPNGQPTGVPDGKDEASAHGDVAVSAESGPRPSPTKQSGTKPRKADTGVMEEPKQQEEEEDPDADL